MDALIDGLTALVSRDFGPAKARPVPPRSIEVELGDAPPSIRALADALAANYYHVDLGYLSMFENGASSRLGSLEGTLEMSCERGGIDPDWVRARCGVDGGAFDPACTIELGADGGGMSYFGVSWSGGVPSIVLVELDDPIEDNIVLHFATPDAFIAFLEKRNRKKELPEGLLALKAAVG